MFVCTFTVVLMYIIRLHVHQNKYNVTWDSKPTDITCHIW